jgi:hypothetical protein
MFFDLEDERTIRFSNDPLIPLRAQDGALVYDGACIAGKSPGGVRGRRGVGGGPPLAGGESVIFIKPASIIR